MKQSARRLLLLLVFLLPAITPLMAQTGSGDDSPPTLSPDQMKLGDRIDPSLRFEIEDAISKKDLDKAEQLLVNEIQGNPNAPTFELLCYLGGVFFADHKYLNAAIAFKKAENFEPLDNGNRFTLAMSYVLLGRPDWARPELEKLASVAPENPLYGYWLARVDFDQGNYEPAIKQLLALVEKHPDFIRAYDRLGLCYERLDQKEQAVAYYKKAIELTSAQPEPWAWPYLNLGAYLIQTGDPQEAEHYLMEALKIDPDFAAAHYRLGMALEKLERFSESAVELRKASSLDPENPDPYWVLARVLRRLGDTEGAAQAVARYQELKAAQDKPAQGKP
jgi:Flp pilus assembly protein TadD